MSAEHQHGLCGTCLTGEYDSFAHECVHESIAKNEAWNAEYGGFDLPRWHYTHEAHTLTISKDGKPRVVCDVITAGTTLNGRWQWSWGNQQADPINREATRAVFEMGEARGWTGITDLFRDADEYTGWECASVANHILSGKATYRFAYGDNDEYFA